MESRNHALTCDGTWQWVILLDDWWYSKNYRLHKIYASYEGLNIRSTKYKHKYSLDLDCFETKRNVDNVDVNLINIQYNIINIVIPRKPMSTSASTRSTLVFSGLQFPMLPSHAVNIYIILTYTVLLWPFTPMMILPPRALTMIFRIMKNNMIE